MLKGGSTLRGKIVGQQEGMLLVETSYGRLEAPCANVVKVEYGLSTPQPVTPPPQYVRPPVYAVREKFASGPRAAA